MRMKKGRHHGSATKSVGSTTGGGGGSNFKLPNPSQAIHVEGQPDRMAHNVGGSSAHMGVGGGNDFGPPKPMTYSGGKGAPKTGRERY